ncbi:MAG TPA: hypothetical protein DHV67_05810 [Gallionella sp.]|nr:hypothetical protein [Gallionella sp.]
MEIKAKKWVLVYLILVLVPIIMLIGAFWAYDPLQLYHKPWGRPATFNTNMRIQAAGIIRNHDFDSIILGTSIMENYSSKEVGKRLSGNFVNISISAGDYFERARVLGFLFKIKNIRNVVYSLDSVYMNTRAGYSLFPYPTYEYLYDNNQLNDIRVYLNHFYIKCLSTWSADGDCVGFTPDLNRPNAWSGDNENLRRFGGLDKWCAASGNYLMQDSIGKIRQAGQAVATGSVLRFTEEQVGQRVASALTYVDKYVIHFVKANPETRFYFVFPPYSRVQYAIWYQYRTINSFIHAAVLRHLAMEASRLPNMQVFGFENEAYSDDIANYMDIVHAHPDHDAYLLASLASGRGCLTLANVESYIEESKQKGLGYDLVGLGKKLDQCARPALGQGDRHG